MRVKMYPNPNHAHAMKPSGITTALVKYAKYAKDEGIEFVDSKASDFDLLAVHAGVSDFKERGPSVAHCHGLYWTAEHKPLEWEYRSNRAVIESLRSADAVTTPSEWVALTIMRDMHVQPFILPHGVDVHEFSHVPYSEKYTLWNKNRGSDACDPRPIMKLAMAFEKHKFISTFGLKNSPANLHLVGLLPHDKMKQVIQSAHLYLATTKETFGIGTLEAMASGVPVLGYNYGGTALLVEHGKSGYLAEPDNISDLVRGYQWCLDHHASLAYWAKERAKQFTWQRAMQTLKAVYSVTLERQQAPSVSVVIPCYNYAHTLERAVLSALNQEFIPVRIVIIDDGSTDDTPAVGQRLASQHRNVVYYRQENMGVAHARNAGMQRVISKYICCLDADDEIAPPFLRVCVEALEKDKTLGCAYTRLTTIHPDGREGLSAWPSDYDFDQFVLKRNQVPTCCVFRADLAYRLGGYRQRYAPRGAGAEDAEFWLRMGASGYGGKLCDNRGLFRYHLGGSVSSGRYKEENWLHFHPWAKDHNHPFASLATPEKESHLVRFYDEPYISVIIPCHKDHVKYLWDALDSLEAQTFRKWEVIVVYDHTAPSDELRRIERAFPYARILLSDKDHRGAGYARNRGGSIAKADHLLFLDADDWLEPDCLQLMYASILDGEGIAYSDYYSYAVITPAFAEQLRSARRLLEYDGETGKAKMLHKSFNYDPDEAQKQPILDSNGQFYIWNLISSLVPKAWHREIGGFDESMSSWEDWDYWIRLSKAGKPFYRLAHPLVNYRFYTGTRREIGRQQHSSLVDYMKNKYKGIENKMCSGCGRKLPRPVFNSPLSGASRQGVTLMASSNDVVRVELIDGNDGDHAIALRDPDSNKVVNYGYRKHGDQLLVSRKHADMYPNRFRILQEDKKAASNKNLDPLPESPPEPSNSPESEGDSAPRISGELDESSSDSLNDIKGISDTRADLLRKEGIETIDDVLSSSSERIAEILGVGDTVAERILASAKKLR